MSAFSGGGTLEILGGSVTSLSPEYDVSCSAGGNAEKYKQKLKARLINLNIRQLVLEQYKNEKINKYG